MCRRCSHAGGGGTSPYVVRTICNGNQRHCLGQRGMPIVLLTHIPETHYSDVVQKNVYVACRPFTWAGRVLWAFTVDTVNLHKHLLVRSDNGVIVFPG